MSFMTIANALTGVSHCSWQKLVDIFLQNSTVENRLLQQKRNDKRV